MYAQMGKTLRIGKNLGGTNVSGKKKLLIALLMVVMLASVAAGLVWHNEHYQMVDFRFYPKNAQLLDIRDQDVSVRHYKRILRLMPDTKVLWSVPFQDGAVPCDTKVLTVITLEDADLEMMQYFEQLEIVDASACEDYDQLLALQQMRPELDVRFTLKLGGKRYPLTTRKVEVSQIAQNEIPYLQFLKNLESVVICGGDSTENMDKLQAYCREKGYDFYVSIGGDEVSDRAQMANFSDITEEDVQLLQFLPNMQHLHLITPQVSAERLKTLQQQYPDVDITWSQTVAGILHQNTDTLIDVSNIQITDLALLEQEMAYFPEATQLEMHFCGIENEEMAAFREKHREDYKVVWTVYLGPKLPTRTDTASIMPARDGTSVFHDEEAYNMRYCEDVIAIDVGHLDVRNVEWAAFMPHLKYLILAWTGVRDLTPLSNCKELVWLELDYSPVSDTTPLIGCTALEDINIGKSSVKANGLVQMPWLKNVWAIGNPGAAYEVAQACPNTRVVASGTHSVGSGWRKLPNYYAMRDALNMFYMDQ